MSRERLSKLSGMKWHGGKTADHWRALVGVDPRDFPRLVEIDQRGRCYWTAEAESLCREYWERPR